MRLSKAVGFAAVFASSVLIAASSAVAAEQTAPAKPVGAGSVIVVVDANRVQRESAAGRAVLAEREKHQQAFNAKFEASRKALQTEEQDLARKRASMPADEFQAKVRELNVKVADFQRRYQNAVRALDRASGQAGNELQKAVIGITGEVASELGANLVLHKQHVFLHDERMDVTSTIIERLNRRLPTVAFPALDALEDDAPTAAKDGAAVSAPKNGKK